jgi:hypothetical protein
MTIEDRELTSIEYKGYRIREDGAVFNRRGKRIAFNIVVNRSGRHYPKFHLYVGDGRELWFGHRLIAWVFLAQGVMSLGEFKGTIVDHIDNDPMNIAVWNLEVMGSHSENLRRRWDEFSEAPF